MTPGKAKMTGLPIQYHKSVSDTWDKPLFGKTCVIAKGKQQQFIQEGNAVK